MDGKQNNQGYHIFQVFLRSIHPSSLYLLRQVLGYQIRMRRRPGYIPVKTQGSLFILNF